MIYQYMCNTYIYIYILQRGLQDLHHSLRSLSKFYTSHYSYPVVIFHDMLTK